MRCLRSGKQIGESVEGWRLNLAGRYLALGNVTAKLAPPLVQVGHFRTAVRRTIEFDVRSYILGKLNVKALPEKLHSAIVQFFLLMRGIAGFDFRDAVSL